jgi:hypothetical protein
LRYVPLAALSGVVRPRSAGPSAPSIEWGSSAAAMAAITLQSPVRVAIAGGTFL